MNDCRGREFLYLSQADVRELQLPMAEIVAALERMFHEKGEGRVEMPPKPGVHTKPDSFLHAMPAYIPAQNAVGMKWVGGYPENYRHKLPYITGLLILNDPETGVPLSVLNHLQFLTIRQFLSLVFAALVLLLLVLAIWP